MIELELQCVVCMQDSLNCSIGHKTRPYYFSQTCHMNESTHTQGSERSS